MCLPLSPMEDEEEPSASGNAQQEGKDMTIPFVEMSDEEEEEFKVPVENPQKDIPDESTKPEPEVSPKITEFIPLGVVRFLPCIPSQVPLFTVYETFRVAFTFFG